MSLLTKNCTPAELARGCFYAERFRSASEIAANQGTITGALEFSNKGAYFDGTNDYLTTQQLTSVWAAATSLSIVYEFYPAWEATADATYSLFDTGIVRNAAQHLNIAAGNSIRFYLGGTNLGSSTYATYSPYWYANKRNVLVIAGTSGSTQVYLNGVQIHTAATAWSPSTDVTNFFINSYSGGLAKSPGWVKSVKIFNQKLTQQEALDYYTGQTFNYNKKAVCILPMTAETHDATNLRTLDVSGKGNHFTFGDGSTASTYPTKLSNRGYGFDGGDYLNIASYAGLSGATAVTVAYVFMPTAAQTNLAGFFTWYNSSTNRFFIDATGTGADMKIRYVVGNGGAITWTTDNAVLNVNKPIVVIGVYDGSLAAGSRCALWIDGVSVAGTVAGGTLPASLGTGSGALRIGANNTPVGATGNFNYCAFWVNKALTPLQILDATLKLKKQLNQV